MANSSYYYNVYKQKKNAVKSYDDDLKDLKKALDNLTDTMYDEIHAVNNTLEELKNNLNNSVRHNSKFTSRANEVVFEKEKTVTADPNLSIAVRELQEEVSRIKALRSQAVSDRDDFYRRYKNKKDEERQELLGKIF